MGKGVASGGGSRRHGSRGQLFRFPNMAHPNPIESCATKNCRATNSAADVQKSVVGEGLCRATFVLSCVPTWGNWQQVDIFWNESQ